MYHYSVTLLGRPRTKGYGMTTLTNAQMADALDECFDSVSGIRTILIALGTDFGEQEALGVLAADLGEVAAKIELVRDQLDSEGGAKE